MTDGSMFDRSDLRDMALFIGVSGALGLLTIALRPDLAWVADPPDPSDAACSIEGGFEEAAPQPLMPRISVEEARAAHGKGTATFVDARGAAAFEAGHVPGAIHLPADEAAMILGVQSVPLPPDELVITYCDGAECQLSEALGMLLEENEVCQQVRVLEGGFPAWQKAGGEVEAIR